MTTKLNTLINYTPSAYPQISGANEQWFANEFRKIRLAINSIEALLTSSGVLSRISLTANAAFYVSVSGNDNNDGSSANPWATLQHAMNFISSTIDFGGFLITVNIGAGSFVGFGAKTTVGGGIIFWKGAGVGSTTITAGPNDGLYNFGESVAFYIASSGTEWAMSECTIDQSASGNDCIYIQQSIVFALFDPTNPSTPVNMAFVLGGGNSAIQTDVLGYFQDAGANITVSGNGLSCLAALAGSQMLISGNYTFVGTPVYSAGFVWQDLLGSIILVGSYTGNVSGLRFCLQNSSVLTNASNTYPSGTTPGVLDLSSSVNGSNDPNFSIATPASGATVNMVQQHSLVLNPSGTLATLRVNLPPAPSTGNGAFQLSQIATPWPVKISTTKSITALTIGVTDGSTVVGAPTTLAASAGFAMAYDAPSNTWYPSA